MIIINFLSADFFSFDHSWSSCYFTDQLYFASAKSLSTVLSVLMIDMAETLI